jgi:hypothetical protein
MSIYVTTHPIVIMVHSVVLLESMKQGQRSSVVPAKFNARKWKHVQKAKVFEC